jgi:hypothetical protein
MAESGCDHLLVLASFRGAAMLCGLNGGRTMTIGYIFLVRHEEHQPLDPWAEGR